MPVASACLLLGALAVPQEATAPHWAYATPQPSTPPPLAEHPVDAWLAQSQRELGLVPTPRTDPATLLRRVSLDLIGLPPTEAELDHFLTDPSPAAYAAAVDRLLDSPHYGERWASLWLDLARYADSDGFNFDKPRSMWPYRDWVVQAFQQDLPYDEFTRQQLAGDLLYPGAEEPRIATGFHRNTPVNDEGGVDPDEARWERLLDRASTTGTVWLGSTLHCARCHDHKYDPVSQREFFGVVAFFESQDEVVLQRAADQAKTLVLQERDGAAAVTTLRLRGAYDAPGESVPAHAPAALHRWQHDGPADRRDLAAWLTDPQHPLVARVHANRLWHALFGRGLVDTPEDFGRQCPPPRQQALLDWLAGEFARLGYRQKPLLRLLVLSAAYQRDAAASADQRDLDPQNTCFARANRPRLDAERIRDTWLLASGLLNRRIGGPPVHPLQADTRGVVPTNKVDMRWPVSPGEERFRRGLYTYWRRTAPFVALAAFDAPSREVCQVVRQSSNTPLQALVGLNDPTTVAAATALGERMQQHAGSLPEQLAFGFRCCTSRWPGEAELALLLAAFAAEPADRAFQRLALTLLNLDETLCRG